MPFEHLDLSPYGLFPLQVTLTPAYTVNISLTKSLTLNLSLRTCDLEKMPAVLPVCQLGDHKQTVYVKLNICVLHNMSCVSFYNTQTVKAKSQTRDKICQVLLRYQALTLSCSVGKAPMPTLVV